MVLESLIKWTQLVLLDYIMSFIGLVFFIEMIFFVLNEWGIDLFIDGVYVIGQLLLDLQFLGVMYYMGNCYKWFCALLGVVFLWV